MQNSITQGQIPKPAAVQAPGVSQVQPQAYQQSQPYVTAPPLNAPAQSLGAQNPNYAGVNIQIFNPMVGTPDGYVYPTQTASAYSSGTQGGCYPANYYTTGNYPQGTFVPQNPYGQPNQMNNAPQGGQYDQNGVYYPATPLPSEQAANGQKPAEGSSVKDGVNPQAQDANKGPQAGVVDGKGENQNAPQSGDNAQKSDAKGSEDSKKTEKRKVVELTDDYIKTLENYLNSQDTEVRLMGAKEVVNRLTEDSSRKDDPALTALVNKMLQDPSQTIRAIALSLIDSRTVLGNDYTVNVLKKMQTSKEGYGQDSVQATSALLKMAGKTVEKEVEVTDKPKQDKKQDTK